MTDVALVKDDLVARGVRHCVGAFVDIHGVPKGKLVPVADFDAFAAGSGLFAGYALDGLGQDANDDELVAVPDLERGFLLPWKRDVAWFPSDIAYRGAEYPLSTRMALKSHLARVAAARLAFNLGIECEVYFLERSKDGELRVPGGDGLAKPCYDAGRLIDRIDLIDEMAAAIDLLDWGLFAINHEDGNGQFEFDFAPTDALTMCDRYVFFRHLARTIAAKHGLHATFMAKPFADKAGNGAHFNMSLANLETGENLFQCAPEDDPFGLGLGPSGYHFVGGIIRHGRALCAACAPTVNSYKRLVRSGLMGYYSSAPVFNSFGGNNRTNAIRVPMGGGRVESRIADSSCNPYLAAALVLAAGLEGISEQIDPGPPRGENLYEFTDDQLAEIGIGRLPRDLGEALAAFASDPFVTDVLGADLQNEFLQCKAREWDDYSLAVTPWERDRYSTMF
jgi:glutamine synthetase